MHLTPGPLVLSALAIAIAAAPSLGQRAPETKPMAQPTSAPTSRPAWTGPFSPAVLPGNGLAQHPFFYAGEWNYPEPQQTMYVVRDGKVVWSHSIPSKLDGHISEFSDATLLSDGSVVYGCMTGAAKVAADQRVVWSYTAPKGYEVHAAQPIGLDRVMYVQNGNPATLVVYNIASAQKETEFVLPTGSPDKTHGQIRRARMTPAGTFLVAHMDAGKVVEYDPTGKEIWSLAVPSPWAAVRLKSGNTLVTSNRGFVHEVTPAGEVVWSFTQADVPDIALFSIQEANRLANGNTIITNWCPGQVKQPADWPQTVQVLEVTPAKQVVWALRAWDAPANLGPATSMQLLDEPGKPEDREQQR